MKRFYYIFPLIGLAVFAFFYSQHVEVIKQREIDRKVAEEKAQLAEKEKKAEAQRKAKEDADRRQKEREAEDAKKLAEKEKKHTDAVAEWNKKIQANRDDTKKYNDEAKASEAKLARLRTEHEALRREAFELAKKVALAEADRRNAELEIQRFASIVADKADQSVLAKIPTPTPAKE